MKLKNKLTWMIMVFFAFSLSHWLGIVSAKEPSKISPEMRRCTEAFKAEHWKDALGPATGYYENDELLMSHVCPECREIETRSQIGVLMKEERVLEKADINKVAYRMLISDRNGMRGK